LARPPVAEGRESTLRRLLDGVAPPYRLAAGGLATILAVYLGGMGLPLPATLFALFGGLLLVDAVRNGPVWAAFRAFREGRHPAMQRGLAGVLWPGLLNRRARTYFHWLRGVGEAADGRFAAARVHLLLAATGNLSTDTDRCLVQCLLAESALQLGDLTAAREHLRLAAPFATRPDVVRLVERLSQRVGD
jgi:hypothetical protein